MNWASLRPPMTTVATAGTAEEPAKRHLRPGEAARAGDVHENIDDVEQGRLVADRRVPADQGLTSALGACFSPAEFAAQEGPAIGLQIVMPGPSESQTGTSSYAASRA